MIDETFFWQQLEKDLFVISYKGLEDFRAVFGAKTSRSIEVEKKWNISYDQVQTFLIQNLKAYGHASIGDMSFVSVFHRGFGWITAWLVEDDPLFNGQEVSSRAVNILKYFPDACNDSDCADIHREFADIYSSISVNSTESYKYDVSRWALPGSVQTGVTVMMTARTFIRNMSRVQNISFAKPAADKYLLGAQHCAPAIFEALNGKFRAAPQRWSLNIAEVDRDNCIKITPPSDIRVKLDNDIYKLPSRINRTSYVSEELNQLGLFKVEILCSIAAARDWHRHRSVMPWKLSLVTKNNLPFISSFYSDAVFKYKDKVDALLRSGMQLIQQQNSLESLYCLPFGTCVKLECYASLNYLLYMLELRAFSHGANKEYSDIAISGLSQIEDIMGETFCKHFYVTTSV